MNPRMSVGRCCCSGLPCVGVINFSDDFSADNGDWRNVFGTLGPNITGGVMEVRALFSSGLFDDPSFQDDVSINVAETDSLSIEFDVDVISGAGATLQFDFIGNDSGLFSLAKFQWNPQFGVLNFFTRDDGLLSHSTTSLTGGTFKVVIDNRTLVGSDHVWDVEFFWDSSSVASGTYTEGEEDVCFWEHRFTGLITTGSSRVFSVDNYDYATTLI